MLYTLIIIIIHNYLAGMLYTLLCDSFDFTLRRSIFQILENAGFGPKCTTECITGLDDSDATIRLQSLRLLFASKIDPDYFYAKLIRTCIHV